jgi:adhesin transport system outer membrane protein
MLTACAPTIPRSYVVLVPDLDGAVGQVVVSGAKGNQVLTRAGQIAGTDGSAVQVTMDTQQLATQFGEAQAAQPQQPEHFMLYFVSGGTRLTSESELKFAEILSRWKAREKQASTDVVVVGHTDTVGSSENNTMLSMQRAKAIADRLRAAGLNPSALTLESHGEKQPLVPTQDGVPEPRNRRVQVTIR